MSHWHPYLVSYSGRSCRACTMSSRHSPALPHMVAVGGKALAKHVAALAAAPPCTATHLCFPACMAAALLLFLLSHEWLHQVSEEERKTPLSLSLARPHTYVPACLTTPLFPLQCWLPPGAGPEEERTKCTHMFLFHLHYDSHYNDYILPRCRRRSVPSSRRCSRRCSTRSTPSSCAPSCARSTCAPRSRWEGVGGCGLEREHPSRAVVMHVVCSVLGLLWCARTASGKQAHTPFWHALVPASTPTGTRFPALPVSATLLLGGWCTSGFNGTMERGGLPCMSCRAVCKPAFAPNLCTDPL